ncbi:sodium/hydrogen exchanger [Anaeramoeba flamelloides]|uniref:Sodium/hydrogen exchanger n=1 Tax=Anaeramoeba flamelloides TaxID=1746091 RepID=A0AAV8ADN2_9EUKA|nr:sodium/hydrogen exchanger [Anaeramoeba flamelloides]
MEGNSYAHYGLILFFVLLTFSIIIAYFLRTRKVTFIHESGTSILLGILFGLIIDLATDDESLRSFIQFDPEIFMLFLLPQIIFESGYNMKRKSFFKNSSTVILFAFVGTLISTLFISLMLLAVVKLGWLSVKFTALDCLIFGSLISATDPVSVLAIFKTMGVHRDLFANVFGESVMNDAIAIVLVKTFLTFDTDELSVGFVFKSIGLFLGIFLGSIAIGVVMGLITAILLKNMNFKENPLLESTLLFVLAWLSFIIAEEIGMSGIAAALFCGIVDAHYAYNNLTDKSKNITKEAIHLIAYISETFVFIYLGLATFTFTHYFKIDIICWSILFCLIGRALHIFPLAALNNKFKLKKNHLPKKYQFVMWFAGLRGAIAFCLSLYVHHGKGHIIMTTTLCVVFFTVFVFGGLTQPLLKKMDLVGKDEEPPVSKNPKNKTNRWLAFDRKFIKPLLTNRKKILDQQNKDIDSTMNEHLLDQSQDLKLIQDPENNETLQKDSNDIEFIENSESSSTSSDSEKYEKSRKSGKSEQED